MVCTQGLPSPLHAAHTYHRLFVEFICKLEVTSTEKKSVAKCNQIQFRSVSSTEDDTDEGYVVAGQRQGWTAVQTAGCRSAGQDQQCLQDIFQKYFILN